MRRDQGWCEDPESPRYNRPVRLPAADCTDRMWRDDHLYDLTFVLDQNFSRRAKGRGSAIFFHLARPGLTPDRRLRRDFAIRHAQARAALGPRRGHGHRIAARSLPDLEKRSLRPFRLAFVFLLAPAIAAADPAPLISDFATARPVVATHGMVVSQEAAASRVGLDVLRLGGNAVDAAVAVGFALAVTLPRAGNLGGGGFMLIHRADLGTTTAIDYRETAPAATTKDVFLDANGKADPFKSRYSGLAIGVPGTVAGLELAWRKYGSGKFSFADLVAPAAALARQGLTVDGDVADTLPVFAPVLAKHPSSARIYLRPDGGAKQAGEHIALDDLAATLETIATQGAAGFYQGPVAQKIVDAVQAAGGRMTMDDLARYRAVEREPVSGTYRGHAIVSMPPPSSGGAHVIEILNILEGYPLSEQGLNSAASLHEMAEAEKLAYADRAAFLGDPDFVKVPLDGPRVEGLCGEAARADCARPGAARRRDPPGRAAALRERPDHPFLDRRRRGQRRRQHLYAEPPLRLGPRRRRDRRAAQRRARRLRRRARTPPTPTTSWAATPTRRGR